MAIDPKAATGSVSAPLAGYTAQDAQGNTYVSVQGSMIPGKPEGYRIARDGSVTRAEFATSGFRPDGAAILTMSDARNVQVRLTGTSLNADDVTALRQATGRLPPPEQARRVDPNQVYPPLQQGQSYPGGPIAAPPAPPPAPPEVARPVLQGSAMQDAQGNKYITVSDPLKPGVPEFYKMTAEGKVTKVDITDVGINRKDGKGVMKVDGVDVQVSTVNGTIGAADILKLREQAAAAAAPAPAPTPAAPPAVTVAPVAPPAPAAAPAAAAINYTAQQRDAYLRIAGFDGKDREAALNAFASKNNLMGADGKPDMQKVNQALQAKVQGTPEAQAYIERVLKDSKATKEEKQTAQWAMVANGAKMPISTKPDGTMDGIIGTETRTQGATVMADLKAGRVQRYAIPAAAPVVTAAPAPTPAPAPVAAPAPTPAAPPTVAVAPAPVPAATVQTAGNGITIPGAIPERAVPQSGGANPIRLGSPEAYRLAELQQSMRQGGPQPFVSPNTPAYATTAVAGSYRPGYYPALATPGFNPNPSGFSDPRVAGTVDTVVRQGEREILARMRGRDGILGAVGEAGATMAEGTFMAGRYDRETARQQAAILAAGGNAPANMRGAFGAAAADPAYLARVAEARASVSDHLRQRSTDAAVEGLAGRVLSGIYAPQGNNGVAGDLLGRIFKH